MVNVNKIDTLNEEVLGLIARRQRNEVTELLARTFQDQNHVYTIRHDKNSEMWIYVDGIYQPSGKTYILEFCRNNLEQFFTATLGNEVIAKIEHDSYIFEKDFFINEKINLVPVLNGVLDIKTEELKEFNHEYKFFTKLGVKFDSKADCPKIIEFFKGIVNDENDVNVLQELFGYLIYRGYPVEKAIMLTGQGRNGKSKTIELMKNFLSPENCCSVSLSEIQDNNFILSQFHNKLANLSADLSATSLKETGTFKNLCGGDMITADRKYLNPINFKNHAKLIYAANQIPISYDISTAFFARWIIIDFPYTFISKNEFDKSENKENLKIADKSIIEKISIEEELSGLLNWALKGLDRLLKQGDFSTQTSIDEVKKNWMRKSSSITSFIEDNVSYEYGEHITKGDFRKEYNEYCRIHKLKPVTDQTIKTQLELMVGSYSSYKTISGDRAMCWCDIKVKSVESVKGVKGEGTFSPLYNNLNFDIKVEKDPQGSQGSHFGIQEYIAEGEFD